MLSLTNAIQIQMSQFFESECYSSLTDIYTILYINPGLTVSPSTADNLDDSLCGFCLWFV